MSKLVNIGRSETPLFIDAAEVTALQVNLEKNELLLFSKEGELLFINYKNWNVDPDDVVKKLAESGNALVSFPLRVNGKEHPRYISPAAVTYATISKPGEDGLAGAIVGVQGHYVDTGDGGATKAEIDNLLTAVQAAKPLLHYAPEDAYSRWMEAGALYIDPKSATQILDDGHSEVRVKFENSGELDIQVKSIKMDRFLPPSYSYEDDADRKIFNASFRELMAYQELHKEESKAARFAFANELAAAHGQLISIPKSDRAVFISAKEISYINFADDAKHQEFQLNIHTKKRQGNTYGDSLSLRFNSKAERQEAFKPLKAAFSGPQKQRKQGLG